MTIIVVVHWLLVSEIQGVPIMMLIAMVTILIVICSGRNTAKLYESPSPISDVSFRRRVFITSILVLQMKIEKCHIFYTLHI